MRCQLPRAAVRFQRMWRRRACWSCLPVTREDARLTPVGSRLGSPSGEAQLQTRSASVWLVTSKDALVVRSQQSGDLYGLEYDIERSYTLVLLVARRQPFLYCLTVHKRS